MNIGVNTSHLQEASRESSADYRPDFSLDDITLKNVHKTQQVALVRLQIFVLGETHRLLGKVAEAGTAVLRRSGEVVDYSIGTEALDATLKAWERFIEDYSEMLGRAMRYAAAIPFGTVAVMHRDIVLPALDAIEESWQKRPFLLTEQQRVSGGVFDPQLQILLDAAQRRVYKDGLQLSGRIWKLDTTSRQGINQIIVQSISDGKSAWDTAVLLEQYLGAGQDCPRWTEDRLYTLTKRDIAQKNRLGLVTGNDCVGQGVSYNALRLARTEIQAIHHMATRQLFEEMPWVEKEKINLSPAHVGRDECDDVVEGGENGDGVYPLGEIVLGLHPNCMCYSTAVLMDNDEFMNQLRGWMRNESPWPEMDSYQQTIGGDISVDLASNGIALSLAYLSFANHYDLSNLFWKVALGS